MEDNFSMERERGVGKDVFRMIRAHYIYCALYSCYYISSTSDHKALDPVVWQPHLPSKALAISLAGSCLTTGLQLDNKPAAGMPRIFVSQRAGFENSSFIHQNHCQVIMK